MHSYDDVMTAATARELGTVVCQKCGEVLYTLPTNGVKKLYGVCPDNACKDAVNQDGGEGCS